MDSRRKWTDEQNATILALYAKVGPKELANWFEVDQRRLTNHAFQLGVSLKFDWTPERLEILKRYPTAGAKKLAEELGVSTWAVTAKARRLGMESTRKKPPKGFEWTDDKIALLKDRYEKEESKVLATELGLHIDTVREKASSLGLHTNVGHVAWGKIRSETNTSCNIHYFDSWSPNMAYILGFTFADGSINKKRTDFRFTIHSKDVTILEFIKRELKTQTQIKTFIYKDKRGWKDSERAVLVIPSTRICQQLENLGCHHRKTYNDDPFPNVPEDMMPHFIRGYLDGDGTTSISSKDVCSVGFVGSPKFIHGLHDALVGLVEMKTKTVQNRKNTTPTCTITWNALEDIKKFYNYIYPEGHGFCLERKKRNLVEWLSKPRFGRGHFFGNKRTGPTEGVKLPPSLLTL